MTILTINVAPIKCPIILLYRQKIRIKTVQINTNRRTEIFNYIIFRFYIVTSKIPTKPIKSSDNNRHARFNQIPKLDNYTTHTWSHDQSATSKGFCTCHTPPFLGIRTVRIWAGKVARAAAVTPLRSRPGFNKWRTCSRIRSDGRKLGRLCGLFEWEKVDGNK